MTGEAEAENLGPEGGKVGEVEGSRDLLGRSIESRTYSLARKRQDVLC